MNADYAIAVADLGKVYPPSGARMGWANSWAVLRSLLVGGSQASKHGFWALREVDFVLRRGEAVALLGKNGSGKSTLLKMITGIVRPSQGTVAVQGRVAALLELGAGFDLEFSGRENYRLNASLLGLSPAQIREREEAVCAFADLGEFIDKPLKTYSTGMQIRLGFAVLTVVEADLLIVDEALSVGDVFFQAKCVRWMKDFLAKGNTLLCASHDLQLIQAFCGRGLVLDQGHLVGDLSIAEAVNLYYRLHSGQPVMRKGVLTEPPPGEGPSGAWHSLDLRLEHRTGGGQIRLLQVGTSVDLRQPVQVNQWIRVRIVAEVLEEVDFADFGFGFRNRSGLLIGGFHTYYLPKDRRLSQLKSGETLVLEFELQIQLAPAEYLLIVGWARNQTESAWEDLDVVWDGAKVLVQGEPAFWGLGQVPSRLVEVERQVSPATALT